MNPEDLARLFHETYERLAPAHGYKTREASAVPWEDVPEANKSLMIAVAAEVGQTAERGVREQVAAEIEARGDEQRGDPENPLTREEWACYGDAARIARGESR